MTEPDNFLTRWSRRKRETAEAAMPEQPAEQSEDCSEQQREAVGSAPGESRGAPETEPFDPTNLPPIESIGANTDVTAFLRPGVPPELTRAALRRAWSSDPAIRDFVGLVENGWDFNDPDAMAGFGPISVGEVARLLSQAIGDVSAETTKPPSEQAETFQLASESGATPPQNEDAVHKERVEQDAEQSDVHCNGNDCASQEKS